MLKKINKAIVSKKNKDIVTVANAVFVKNDSKMEVPFVTRNKDVFQCEVRNADFEDPASACASINAWVRNETQGEWPRVPGTSGRGFLFCGRRRESGSETLPGVSESSGPPVVKALGPTDCTVLSLLAAPRLSLSSSFPFPDVGTAHATPRGLASLWLRDQGRIQSEDSLCSSMHLMSRSLPPVPCLFCRFFFLLFSSCFYICIPLTQNVLLSL